MATCKRCNVKLSTHDFTCPQCGSKNNGIDLISFFVVLILFAILGGCLVFGKSKNEPNTKNTQTSTTENKEVELPPEAVAWPYAKKCVKENLKFPDDATFPFLPPDAEVILPENVVIFNSTVKAKNSFGAELTHKWKAVILVKIKENKIFLLLLRIDGEIVYVGGEADDAILSKIKNQ